LRDQTRLGDVNQSLRHVRRPGIEVSYVALRFSNRCSRSYAHSSRAEIGRVIVEEKNQAYAGLSGPSLANRLFPERHRTGVQTIGARQQRRNRENGIASDSPGERKAVERDRFMDPSCLGRAQEEIMRCDEHVQDGYTFAITNFLQNRESLFIACKCITKRTSFRTEHCVLPQRATKDRRIVQTSRTLFKLRQSAERLFSPAFEPFEARPIQFDP